MREEKIREYQKIGEEYKIREESDGKTLKR